MSVHPSLKINPDKTTVEWYTPQYIIDAVRECLGTIDLDPASSEEANKIVKASRIFTRYDDGLAQQWGTIQNPSKVWMNHPYGREFNKAWASKLVRSYTSGVMAEGVCIVYASLETEWFRILRPYPRCELNSRVYFLKDGDSHYTDPLSGKRIRHSGSQKTAVVVYVGPNLKRFDRAFRHLGEITCSLEYLRHMGVKV